MKKLTLSEIIKKSNNIHNNKYDYSLSEYVDIRTKIKIICPIHGTFEQRPDHHQKHGCRKCGTKNMVKNQKSSLNNFIKKSNKIHNNKYDYSISKYVNNYTKLKIICPIHGEFEQLPNNHISKKQGCPKCNGGIKLTLNQFINKSNQIHKNKYVYSSVKYINNHTKVKIICPIHDTFEQIPNSHMSGKGCPKCGHIKKRISRIKRINENIENGYQLIPNFNKNACKIFDKISKEKNIHIQHAMNGGEFYIKELGYWVDGYDEKNNIVYEFDEIYHKYITDKDIKRQNEIKYVLKCEFIRIKENK